MWDTPYFNYLARLGKIKKKISHRFLIQACSSFEEEYLSEKIEELYQKQLSFLTENGLLKNNTNFTEFEISHLMQLNDTKTISIGNGKTLMDDIREKILRGKEGRKGISKSYFKASKYIEKGSALEKAVLQIIGVDHFPQKEGQGIYRIPCKDPKCIILCENGYFLTLDLAQQRHVELWHVGGNNTLPIDNLPKIDYPIFYLCDWDQTGLEIYERIHQRIESIPDKASSLQLIPPQWHLRKHKRNRKSPPKQMETGYRHQRIQKRTILPQTTRPNK